MKSLKIQLLFVCFILCSSLAIGQENHVLELDIKQSNAISSGTNVQLLKIPYFEEGELKELNFTYLLPAKQFIFSSSNYQIIMSGIAGSIALSLYFEGDTSLYKTHFGITEADLKEYAEGMFATAKITETFNHTVDTKDIATYLQIIQSSFFKKLQASQYLNPLIVSIMDVVNISDEGEIANKALMEIRALSNDELTIISDASGSQEEANGKITLKHKVKGIKNQSATGITGSLYRFLSADLAENPCFLVNFAIHETINAKAHADNSKNTISTSWGYPLLLNRYGLIVWWSGGSSDLLSSSIQLMKPNMPQLEVFSDNYKESYESTAFSYSADMGTRRMKIIGDLNDGYDHLVYDYGMHTNMELFFYPNLSFLFGWGIQNIIREDIDYPSVWDNDYEIHSISLGPRIYYPLSRGIRTYASLGYEGYYGMPEVGILEDDNYATNGIYIQAGTKLLTRKLPMWYLNLGLTYFQEIDRSSPFSNLTFVFGIGIKAGGYKNIY